MYYKIMAFLTAIYMAFASLFYTPTAVTSVNPNGVKENDGRQDSVIMTYNLKTSGVGKYSIENRKDGIIDTVNSYKPDSVGFQEANENWMSILSESLIDYAYVGVGRDENNTGEASPVFYLKEKYNLIQGGTFWLSETPDKVSKGWDAMLNRVCSYAVLENKETGFTYAHFNAHFDHIGVVARLESAALVSKKIAEICPDIPVVFTGDLNDDEGSDMYNRIVESGMQDTKKLAADTMDVGTYHGYSAFQTKNRTKPIDFVFANGYVESVASYKVDFKEYNGIYPSDHHPIIVNLTFKEGEKFMKENGKYRVMSANVLCWGDDDHSIYKRIPLVIKMIKEVAPDSFGVQEAHWLWIEALSKALPDYDYVGVGRDDGKKEGEYSAVFYLKDKFTPSDSGYFWLSETPDVPSKGWDAACKRIATYVKLTDVSTGDSYVHINTHLDHVGVEARVNGVKMIQEKAASFNGTPVVVTGDFNVDQGSDCYQTMVSANMGDARLLAEETDDACTYHDFKPEEGGYIIDFIFIDKATIKANKFDVVDKLIDGQFYSDHYAIYSDIELI